jgi:hypothetical protein
MLYSGYMWALVVDVTLHRRKTALERPTCTNAECEEDTRLCLDYSASSGFARPTIIFLQELWTGAWQPVEREQHGNSTARQYMLCVGDRRFDCIDTGGLLLHILCMASFQSTV